MTHILRCDLHDYIEVACLFGYHIQITLKAGDSVSGIANTTFISSNKEEFLKITPVDKNGTEHNVLLTDLKNIRVLTENSRFDYIDFC